jgi:hypothetical protein
VEALFDFDRLVEQLGAETPPGVEALDAFPAGQTPAPSLTLPAGDAQPDEAFAKLEADLREHDERAATQRNTDDAAASDAQALNELESWLEYLKTTPR